MPNEIGQATFRLTDLQRSHAADATLKNLLSTLTNQIQSCSRLAVFEYEADSEGHKELALAFHDLAEIERTSFNTLLQYLRRHLNELPAEPAQAVHHPRTEAVNR